MVRIERRNSIIIVVDKADDLMTVSPRVEVGSTKRSRRAASRAQYVRCMSCVQRIVHFNEAARVRGVKGRTHELSWGGRVSIGAPLKIERLIGEKIPISDSVSPGRIPRVHSFRWAVARRNLIYDELPTRPVFKSIMNEQNELHARQASSVGLANVSQRSLEYDFRGSGCTRLRGHFEWIMCPLGGEINLQKHAMLRKAYRFIRVSRALLSPSRKIIILFPNSGITIARRKRGAI